MERSEKRAFAGEIMKYCADTWFILAAFENDPTSQNIVREAKEGKTSIVIPMTVFAESVKKLLQRGVPQSTIDLFWQGVESSKRVTLLSPDKETAREAAKVSLTYAVPLLDSFVAATCKITGCGVLLSADSDYRLLAKRKYLKVQSW